MKKFLGMILFLVACTHPDNKDLALRTLIKTDEDFNLMCQEKGFKDAFIFYAADNMIKMLEGKQPLFDKQELIKSMENLPAGLIHLSWVPIKADVSGDLGYTFGKWEMRIEGKDTVEYGTYVTIWKRQSDGTWKYVLDGGNSTPKPQ